MTDTPTSSEVTAAPSAPASALRRPLLWVGLVVLALVAMYAALVAASGDGLPRGATVLGVPVGGLSEAQAATVLEQQLGKRAEDPIEATVGTATVAVVPADSGLTFDPVATVDGLEGRIWNPLTLISQLGGSPAIDPVVKVDDAALAATVATLATDNDKPPVEPSIDLGGAAPTLVAGVNGTALDQPAAAEALRASYLVYEAPVELPIVETAPTVTQEKAEEALDLAKAAVAAPITVKVGEITTSIPPVAIARALAFTPQDGQLAVSLDGEVLRSSVADALAPVETPGRDATWDVSSGKPVVVPSKVGTGVSSDDLAGLVAGVMTATDPAARTISPVLGVIEPELTTEEAKALGVVEKLGSFKQNFPYAAYRFQNIGQAGKYMNGTLLKPGETFSLNKVIKERTVANGYTVGFVIGPGGIFKEDQGGGVSASATTAWSAAFYSGLERVYTQAHSIWIPRYQPGLEATVAWGSFDMKFKNDTPTGVLITTDMRRTSLTVTMWGTKVYDDVKAEFGPKRKIVPFTTVYSQDPECRAQGGQEGFTIDVDRVFYKAGKEVKRETITTRYRPSPTVVCGPKPSDKPSASPSPTGTATKAPAPVATTTKPVPAPSPT